MFQDRRPGVSNVPARAGLKNPELKLLSGKRVEAAWPQQPEVENMRPGKGSMLQRSAESSAGRRAANHGPNFLFQELEYA